ncbi:MAG: transcription termination factor NusA [Kistimonas sp.]|nr:transcription termination factor NusA [Kistimonas sp.]
MSKDILLVVESVSNEKGVPSEVIFEAIELALATAVKKKRYSAEVDIRVAIDRATGDYETFRRWTLTTDEDFEDPEMQMTLAQGQAKDETLSVGDAWEEPIESVEFGRIAAQTAKQVIVQKVREAERRQMVEAYSDKIGELLSGTVKKVTREVLIVDLGNNAEAVLRKDQLIPREVFRMNAHIRALLSEIADEGRGPQLVMSRTCPEMLVELFRIEVPEIAEEVIEIKGAARDPGSRAKVAVKTNDGRIDPVGACVGMRGSRVQAVSNELGSERVDIVPWSDDPVQFVINAMHPAEVASIIVDEDSRSMDLAVAEDNLAQAIGRGGQNVRLASELTGWTLNVMTEADVQQKQLAESEGHAQTFVQQLDIEADLARNLIAQGFTSLEEIAYVPAAELVEVEGLSEERIDVLRQRAKDYLLTRAIAEEEKLDSAGLEQDLEKLLADFLDNDKQAATQLGYQLASRGIRNSQALAEQATDDLEDIVGLDPEQAGELIMSARNTCWFGKKC